MLLALVIGTFAFSEIMYDWPGADTNHEWVEMINCSAAAVEITSDFRFFDGANHLIADPVRGSRSIPAGGVFVLAADAKTATSTFFSDNPGFTGTVFDTVMSLGNSGDTLELRGEGGIVLAAITYGSDWGGQGSGKSIEKESPCNGSPSSGWKELPVMGGTPGSALFLPITTAPTVTPAPTLIIPSPSLTPEPTSLLIPAPTIYSHQPTPSASTPRPTPAQVPAPTSLYLPPQISPTPQQFLASSPFVSPGPSPFVAASVPLIYPIINEFLPSPAGPDAQNEYIELVNPSAAALDISGWFLDDKDGGSLPYQILAGTIMAPKSILVFAGATTHIALNNDGDSVRLLEPGKIVSQSVTYGKAEEGQVYARKENGAWQWSSLPTPGSANVFTEATPRGQTEKNLSPAETTSVSTPFASSTGSRTNAASSELDLTKAPPRKSLSARIASADMRSFVLATSMAVSGGLLLVFIRKFF